MFQKNNNFDFLRLFAAFQVVFFHALIHLEINLPVTFKHVVIYFENYPGVLMFFTISGFLISSSLDRNKNLLKYFKNRILRIFPALLVCFIFTFILLILFKIINLNNIFTLTILEWILTQITFFQFWTPSIFRSWGVGTPNGSLWTIPVEIQFYVILPLITYLSQKTHIIIGFFIIIFSLFINWELSHINGSTIILKLLKVSVFPHLWSFLIGVITYHLWEKIKPYFVGKALYWFVAFNCYIFISGFGPSYWPIFPQLISNFLLSFLTISFAFTIPELSKILKGNDLSYGIYIYHMLIVNTFVELGMIGQTKYLYFLFLLTIIFAFFSWRFIESKFLKYKL